MAISEAAPVELMDVGVASRPPLVRWYLEHERLAIGVLVFAVIFGYWQFGSYVGLVNVFFFSSPSLIMKKAVAEFQTSIFWTDVVISLGELVVGFLVGAVLGVVLGLLTGWYRRLNMLLNPLLSFFYALPKIAIIPIFVLWFGLNSQAVIAGVFIGTFLTVLINTLHGVHTVNHRLLEVAASFRASQLRIFTHVVFPSTLPFIITGLRLGVGQAMIGVFVGELFASTNAGLGYLIDNAGDVADSTTMLFGVIIFTVIGMTLIGSLRLIENRFHRWRVDVGTP